MDSKKSPSRLAGAFLLDDVLQCATYTELVRLGGYGSSMGKGKRLRAARRAGKKCIFCGDPVGSGEHLLPDWLKHSKTIDHTQVNHTQSQTFMEVVRVRDDSAVIIPNFDEKRRGGAATNRKEPVVCGPCNNGWMSNLENKTKPILLPMIDDESRALNEEDQRTIARWADKVVMVVETTGPKSAVTTHQDRLRVMDESQPRPALRTQLWIGRTEHSPRLAHPLHTYLKVGGSNGEIEKLRVDVLILGYVCLVVTGSESRVYEPAPIFADQMSDRLVRIWPITSQSVQWPPPATMTTEDIETARASIYEMQVRF
jgi:hypothetical protein